MLVDDHLHRRRPGSAEVHQYCIVIYLLYRFQRRNKTFAGGGMRFWKFDRILGDDAFKCKNHIIGGHLRPIVEIHTLAQLNFQGHIVKPVHFLCYLHVDAAASIASDQPIDYIAE